MWVLAYAFLTAWKSRDLNLSFKSKYKRSYLELDQDALTLLKVSSMVDMGAKLLPLNHVYPLGNAYVRPLPSIICQKGEINVLSKV